MFVDEANRLEASGLERLRDLDDSEGFALVLIGMPSLEKTLARYPQLSSRVGFAHRFRELETELGVRLGPEAFADPEGVAALLRTAGGNPRLIQRMLQQAERTLEINDLAVVTPEVVRAARELLVIGAS